MEMLKVEGDSKILIHVINLKFKVPWRLNTLMKDIHRFFEHISFYDGIPQTNFTTNVLGSFKHNLDGIQI